MRLGLGLRIRLMLLVGAAMVPLMLLSTWFAVREMEANTGQAQRQLQFAASLVAGNQDRVLESTRALLHAIAQMPGMDAPQPSACQPYFKALRDRLPMYSNIGLLDLQGEALCHANGAPGSPSGADRDYFQNAVAQRRFTVGKVLRGRASGRLAIPVSLPLLKDGRVAGVAFAALDLAYASSALGAVALPDGARVLVVDRDARVLMDYPPRADAPAGRPLANEGIAEMARQMRAGTGVARDKDGLERVFAAAVGHEHAGERYLSLVSLPRAQVMHASVTRLRQQLALTALTLLAGLIAAWWVGSRMVMKPAKQILGTVRRLEQGSLEARVPLAGHATEFARIGAAFNHMAESLQQRQLDLQSELARSRGAYELLDTILNSMQEGLMAVDRDGRVLMHNRAAARICPLEGEMPAAADWPRHFGMYLPDGRTLYEAQDMPFARAMRGESGEALVLVRNAQVPEGRLLRCSYQPLRRGDALGTALVVFTDVTDLEQAESDVVLLRNAVARLNDIVLITEAQPIDAPGPRIVFVNEAFERLTGYSAAEAIGNTPRMLQGAGTDRATLDRIRSALQQGQPVREELLNYDKAGRPLWLELDIVPLADESGRSTHLIAVQRDITARKQGEQALLASERALQDYNRMLQHTAEAAQAITRHRRLEDTLQEVVDQARAVIGAQAAVLSLTSGGDWAQAIMAKSLSPRYAHWREWDEPPTGEGIYQTVLENGRPLRLTQAQLTAHPRWRDFSGHAQSHPPLRGLLAVPLVDGRGTVVGLLQLTDRDHGDFTERDEYVAIELAQLGSIAIENARLFEQIGELNAGLESRIAERTAELARQEKRFRALAEQAPEIVWNVRADGGVTYFNRRWYELVGGQAPDWLGEGWMSRVHPDDMQAVREGWALASRSLQPYSGTRRLLARDGSWHTTSYRAVPVLDQGGKLEFWVGIDADITELKAIEQALRDSNQELEAFSYSVSHDLRAPLGAIDGFSKALAGRLEGVADDKARHYLARIQAGVTKMEQLIEALLGLSRVARAALSQGTVDLALIARETVEGLRVQDAQRDVRVRIDEPLLAQGDARLLRVLMENLLGNAWKFTSRTEDAAIEVGRDEADGAYYVRDNGAGFDMAYANKLFNVFQRLHTEAEFPGTGIGLATVRRIVTRHQGAIWVESQPGRGTTFRFTLGAVSAGLSVDA
jgi:PAS domain S-box-containing protein